MPSDSPQSSLLDKVASFYDVSRDYDIANTRFASLIMCPLCQGLDVLEIGCATGEMTGDLLEAAKTLSVLEPASRYCEIVKGKFGDRITVYNSFLEELKIERRFDAATIASVLHHVPEPRRFLEALKGFLNPGGFVLATVPNVLSLHRQVGVKAGLLKDPFSNSERNIRFHQVCKFTRDSLNALFVESGYEVLESYGYMLKPFSSEQMLQLKLDWNVMMALFELGKENQHLASQLFIRARPR